VFRSAPLEHTFEQTLNSRLYDRALRVVDVAGVVKDGTSPRMMYEPTHPDADGAGYVAYPNVNVVSEMVDLMTATRAYEANVQAIRAMRVMGEAALRIGSQQ
jgi:flagellar basal-body rod protein FlgC